MNAIGPVARIDDHAERRSGVWRNRAGLHPAGEILPTGEGKVAADRLQAVDPLLRDAGHVGDYPALGAHDAREFGVRGLEALDLELEVRGRAGWRLSPSKRVH